MNLILDCDGVLTDGKMYIDATGAKMFKAFHSRDVRALREFIVRGFRVIIVTADDWPGTKHFADKCGCELIVMRNKADVVQFLANNESITYGLGDDAWDVSFLKLATHKFIPLDCHKSVSAIEGVTRLRTKGGEGVVAELLDYLLANGSFKPL